MSVLQRKDLEDSPLADLHAIAAELALEGYRTLRRDERISAILDAQGGGEDAPEEDTSRVDVDQDASEAGMEQDASEAGMERDVSQAADIGEGDYADASEVAIEPPGVASGPDDEASAHDESARPEDETVAGVLDILPNGSGFLRLTTVGQSRDDVYVAPAQIRRCELRPGDEVSGHVRPPRRNERHPSLVRVASVNGADPEPPAPRPRFSELTPVFAVERLSAPSSVASVPFGKGSRVAVAGPPGAGATTLLWEVAATLVDRHPEVSVAIVLVGVRPEEATEWRREARAPVYGGGFDGSLEGQAQAAELAAERAKRIVEGGRDAALVVDSLAALPPPAARRVFGAARRAEEGGSLTVIASTGGAEELQRLATTRIVLEPPSPDGSGPRVLEGRSATIGAGLLG